MTFTDVFRAVGEMDVNRRAAMLELFTDEELKSEAWRRLYRMEDEPGVVRVTTSDDPIDVQYPDKEAEIWTGWLGNECE